MAKKVTPLTDTQIKKAYAREKEYNLGDGDGLSLKIYPTGTKSWIFTYSKPYTKKRDNMSFGIYGDVSLARARDERAKARTLLAQNIDPKQFRDNEGILQANAHANTFEVIATKWLELKKHEVMEDTAKDIWRSLEIHILPELGNHPIHALKARTVIDTLKPIEAKGSLETVKRLTGRINEIMDFSVNNGYIESNPLSSITKAFKKPLKKHYPTITPEQLPELMQKLSASSIKFTTRCLIEWQLHTMMRPSEAAGTKWAEIDFKNKLWNIPDIRMKKKRFHSVPLSPQSLALLDLMKPISSHREFVFPGDRNPRTHMNSQTANAALKRIGYKGLLVSHGFRSIASTALNEQGFNPDAIEVALSHLDDNEVRAAYNRSDYLEQRKSLMCWSSNFIEQAATGNTSLASSNVIPIKFNR